MNSEKQFSVTCVAPQGNSALRRNEYRIRRNVVTGIYSGKTLTYKEGWCTTDFAKANELSLEDAEKVFKPFHIECLARIKAVKMGKVSRPARDLAASGTVISHNGTDFTVSGNVVTGLLDGQMLTYKAGNRLQDFAKSNGLDLSKAGGIFIPFKRACLDCLDLVNTPVFIVRDKPAKPRKKCSDKPVVVHRLPSGRSPSSGSIDGGGRQHPYTGHPDEFEMERGFKRCRFCGKPAMVGSDLCYSCESD